MLLFFCLLVNRAGVRLYQKQSNEATGSQLQILSLW